MFPTTNSSQQPIKRHLVTSVGTLTLWRWRQHWFLLLMICIGMITSVTIVCTIPLLSATMQTAGLRNVLRATKLIRDTMSTGHEIVISKRARSCTLTIESG